MRLAAATASLPQQSSRSSSSSLTYIHVNAGREQLSHVFHERFDDYDTRGWLACKFVEKKTLSLSLCRLMNDCAGADKSYLQNQRCVTHARRYIL